MIRASWGNLHGFTPAQPCDSEVSTPLPEWGGLKAGIIFLHCVSKPNELELCFKIKVG